MVAAIATTPSAVAVTLDVAWSAFINDREAGGKSLQYIKSIQAIRSKLRTLGLAAADTTVEVMSPEFAQAFFTGMRREGLAAATIRHRGIMLKTFAAFLYERGWTATHTLERLKIPSGKSTPTDFITGPEMRMLLEATRYGHDWLRDKAIILTGVTTGMRVSELAAVHWDHLDTRQIRTSTGDRWEGRVRVLHGKGDKFRIVPLDDLTIRALNEWRDAKHTSERVFGISADAIRSMLAVTSQRARVKHIAPHMLRVTFATNFLRVHPDAIYQLMLLLGHTQLEQTVGYLRMVRADTELTGPSVAESLGLN